VLCFSQRALRLARRSEREKRIIKKQSHRAPLNGATIDALQKLDDDRMQETHVLGTAYRKTIHAKVTDHLWYVVERFAELAEDICVQLLVLLDAHVHEAAGAPGTIKERIYYRAEGRNANSQAKFVMIDYSELNLCLSTHAIIAHSPYDCHAIDRLLVIIKNCYR